MEAKVDILENIGNPSIPTFSKNLDLTEFSDLEIPIAHRKGIRSCTMHPISNYVSYQKLSPSFKAFAICYLMIQFQETYRNF